MQDKALIIAGEDSGDNYGAHLIEELINKDKNLKIFAIGGNKIKNAGGILIENFKKFSVVGITEVIKHLPDVFKTLRKIENFIKNNYPKFVILIDFPDFNFRVAKIANKYNIPVYYFVSPQVWAWRQRRVFFLKKYIRKIFVIFPFEEDFYKQFNINAKFIGHPLSEKIKNFQPEMKFLDNNIAILPGSRNSEIKKLLPVFIKTAKLIKKDFPYINFILPVAPSLDFEKIKLYTLKRAPFIKLIKGQSYEAINASNIVISASGTATLEAALFGKPVVIVYKVNLFSYLLGKMFIKVNFIGMPNLLLGNSYNPELIQKKATSKNIFIEVKKFIKNNLKYEKIANLNKNLLNELYKKTPFKTTINLIYNDLTTIK